MKTSEHVTRNQIAAFGAGSLATSDSRTVGGHLIRCVECRSLLPIPDSGQVWSAVTREHVFSESQPTLKSPSPNQSYSQTVVGLFRKRNRLAWAGSMLAFVVCLTGLLIFNSSNRRNVETEVARSFELENPAQASNHNQANGMNAAVPASSETDPETKGTNSISTGRESPRDRQKPNSRILATDNRAANGANRKVAATRGAFEPCVVGRTIEMELGSTKTDVVLRWKPVPKAARYHVYVSDGDEILIDEFETDQDTSYVLKKPLDPTRSYKWKIVITLESGQKLYVDGQKFSAKDIQSSLNGYKSKARSNTRCLAN